MFEFLHANSPRSWEHRAVSLAPTRFFYFLLNYKFNRVHEEHSFHWTYSLPFSARLASTYTKPFTARLSSCLLACLSIHLSVYLPFTIQIQTLRNSRKNTFVFFNKYIFTPTHINKALHISKQEELLMNSVWRLFSFVLPALWCPYLDYIQGLLDVTLNFHFFSLSTQLVLELFDLPPYIYFRAKHNTGGMLCLSAIPMEQRSLILKIPASLPPGTPDILNPLHLKPQQLGGNYCKTAFIFSKYSEFPVVV